MHTLDHTLIHTLNHTLIHTLNHTTAIYSASIAYVICLLMSGSLLYYVKMKTMAHLKMDSDEERRLKNMGMMDVLKDIDYAGVIEPPTFNYDEEDPTTCIG